MAGDCACSVDSMRSPRLLLCCAALCALRAGQQIAILSGCAVLSHLKSLVDIIEHGLNDEQSKVRCIAALALAALAEASHPYGIESFDSVLRPLWKGIRSHRGTCSAAACKHSSSGGADS